MLDISLHLIKTCQLEEKLLKYATDLLVKCVSLPKKFPSIIGVPLKRFLPGHLTMKIHSILLTLNSKMCWLLELWEALMHALI